MFINQIDLLDDALAALDRSHAAASHRADAGIAHLSIASAELMRGASATSHRPLKSLRDTLFYLKPIVSVQLYKQLVALNAAYSFLRHTTCTEIDDLVGKVLVEVSASRSDTTVKAPVPEPASDDAASASGSTTGSHTASSDALDEGYELASKGNQTNATLANTMVFEGASEARAFLLPTSSDASTLTEKVQSADIGVGTTRRRFVSKASQCFGKEDPLECAGPPGPVLEEEQVIAPDIGTASIILDPPCILDEPPDCGQLLAPSVAPDIASSEECGMDVAGEITSRQIVAIAEVDIDVDMTEGAGPPGRVLEGAASTTSTAPAGIVDPFILNDPWAATSPAFSAGSRVGKMASEIEARVAGFPAALLNSEGAGPPGRVLEGASASASGAAPGASGAPAGKDFVHKADKGKDMGKGDILGYCGSEWVPFCGCGARMRPEVEVTNDSDCGEFSECDIAGCRHHRIEPGQGFFECDACGVGFVVCDVCARRFSGGSASSSSAG
jgi:hypothetical protein